jgi:hypothetical protein
MTVLYSNNFDAETVGTLPANWYSASGNWLVQASRPTSAPNGLKSTNDAALDAVIYKGAILADGVWAYSYLADTANNATAGMGCPITLVFRSDATFANGYLINFSTNMAATLYKRVSSAYTAIGTSTSMISPPTFSAGDIMKVELTVSGSTFALRIWNATTGGTRPSTANFTTTDATYTAAGYFGVALNKGTSPGPSPSLDDVSLNDGLVAATATTLTGPGSGDTATASSNFTVAANGSIAGTVIVTPNDASGGGTFTPTSVSISAASPTGTFTYTPASVGIKSIATTNNGGLTNPTAISYNVGSVTIDRTNAALYYSPGNWADDGTSRISANPGAYVKFSFTGTALTLLTTALASMTAYPQLRAIIDAKAYDVGMSTSGSYPIVTGLASGTHTCELYLRSSLYSAGSWWTFVNALKITGLKLDAGASVTAPTTRPYISFIFGDSLTQAYFLDGTNSPGDDDALGNYVSPMAEALNSEYSQVGWGGTSFALAGVSNVPAFNTSYALVASGFSRMTAALFATQPDYITVMLGTNGTTVQSDVATSISNLRTAAPNARIFFIVPGNGSGRAAITAAVNATITAGDTKLTLIDAGTRYQVGFSGTPPTEASFDTVHYKRRTNARLGGEWIRQMQHALEARRFTVVVS